MQVGEAAVVAQAEFEALRQLVAQAQHVAHVEAAVAIQVGTADGAGAQAGQAGRGFFFQPD
ncbi:MAG: hypothetical protein WKG07_03570 [Hymenobacter sp.]